MKCICCKYNYFFFLLNYGFEKCGARSKCYMVYPALGTRVRILWFCFMLCICLTVIKMRIVKKL